MCLLAGTLVLYPLHRAHASELDTLLTQSEEALKDRSYDRAADLLTQWQTAAAAENVRSDSAERAQAILLWNLGKPGQAVEQLWKSARSSSLLQRRNLLATMGRTQRALGESQPLTQGLTFSACVLTNTEEGLFTMVLGIWLVVGACLLGRKRPKRVPRYSHIVLHWLGGALLVGGLSVAAYRQWVCRYGVLVGEKGDTVKIYRNPDFSGTTEDHGVLPTGTLVTLKQQNNDALQIGHPLIGWLPATSLIILR